MNSLVILIIGCVVLMIGYIAYGGWLAKKWGIDEKRKTPAYEFQDGKDYVPAKAPVLMGHHFSSIAGAGPINGPIQAAVFGWVPVLLWILIGGIFFGGVHDFGALFASIRHGGKSIGEVIADSMGVRAKKLFLIFAYLTLILVVATFSSIVANTFMATYDEMGMVNVEASSANAITAMISILFILVSIVFGFLVYRRNAGLVVSTIIGVLAIVICMIVGMNFHPLYLSNTTWMIIVGIYITIASVTPVWILLQPRDYLSSFLLYFMMAIAVVAIVGDSIFSRSVTEMPAFLGFQDTLFADNGYAKGTSLGYLFPALFVTIACGAISGFHSLVASGTTAKQLDNEKNARAISYGGMLIECVLGIISLCAVGEIWNLYKTGEMVVPTKVFATGITTMMAKIPGLAGCQNILYSLLVLTVSAFCLTSLDTATRLARYMFQEFWTEQMKTSIHTAKWIRVLTNPLVATGITVILGILLGMTGYAQIWPLFGASNQLLAAIGLMAVATWLGEVGKNNKMFIFPMIFMMLVTWTALALLIKTNIIGIINHVDGVIWCHIRNFLALFLIIFSIILAKDGFRVLKKQRK